MHKPDTRAATATMGTAAACSTAAAGSAAQAGVKKRARRDSAALESQLGGGEGPEAEALPAAERNQRGLGVAELLGQSLFRQQEF